MPKLPGKSRKKIKYYIDSLTENMTPEKAALLEEAYKENAAKSGLGVLTSQANAKFASEHSHPHFYANTPVHVGTCNGCTSARLQTSTGNMCFPAGIHRELNTWLCNQPYDGAKTGEGYSVIARGGNVPFACRHMQRHQDHAFETHTRRALKREEQEK